MAGHVRRVGDAEVPASGTWNIDPAHSVAGFVARHLMVTKVRGRFGQISGHFEVADDPTESTVQVRIDASTVETGAEDRDNHLRSGDFLDVENHPTIDFVSSSVERTPDGWNVHGDLTIRGTTRPVTLDTRFEGVMVDPWGNPKAAFSARTEINREDWGLEWNVPLESGGWLVGKQVQIEIDVQAAKSDGAEDT